MSDGDTLDTVRGRLLDGFRDARVPTTTNEIADDWEVREVRDLVGKHWTEIPFETLFLVRWDLNWFHRAGIRQYLPALMMAAVRNTEIAELVIQYLGDDVGERQALWPDEKRAVRAWLRYMRDQLHNEDAAQALAAYWDDPPIKPLEEERVALLHRAREVFARDRIPHEAADLVATVTKALDEDSMFYQLRQRLTVAETDDAARRAPLVHALSSAQLAFVVDLLDYLKRRWPETGDDIDIAFWRAQLAARNE